MQDRLLYTSNGEHPILDKEARASWLEDHGESWAKSYREHESPQVVIGCSDYRVQNDLSIPGLGIMQMVDQGKERVLERFRRIINGGERRIVLQTHADCAAFKKFSAGTGRTPEDLMLEFRKLLHDEVGASGWLHVREDELVVPDYEPRTIYLDPGDRFLPGKELPAGYRLSAMWKDEFWSNAWLNAKRLVMNGMRREIDHSLKLLMEVASKGNGVFHKFSAFRPLTLIVAYDKRRPAVSKDIHALAFEKEMEYHGCVRAVAIDNDAKIVDNPNPDDSNPRYQLA